MTLRQLVTSVSTKKIKIPDKLSNLEVKNYEDFCNYALAKYFESLEFQHDLYTAEYEIFVSGYAGIEFYFVINRNVTTRDFWISLVHVCSSLEEEKYFQGYFF